MATTAVSSTPSAASILSSVGSLQQSIQAAASRVQTQNSSSASSSTTSQTSTTPEVQEFRKDVRKSPYKTANAATDIGILVKNSSRLNVISTLATKDTADFYKFKVTNSGEVTLGRVGDENLRVQVMTKLGSVVADSNEKAGKQRETYQKMLDGTYTMERGDYVIRISRESSATQSSTATKGQNYAIQMRMGSYNRDFDTVAQASRASDAIPQQSVGMQKLQDMLNSGASFIQSLPAIGTPATQKLLGTVFSTSA